MAEPQMQKSKASAAQFIAAVEDDRRRKDAKATDKLMRRLRGEDLTSDPARASSYGARPLIGRLQRVTAKSPGLVCVTLESPGTLATIAARTRK